MKNKKALFWSGGLTSLTTLKEILKTTDKNDVVLLCLLNKEGNELGHTGIPEEVLQLQARYLGIKLVRLYQDELSKKVLTRLSEQDYEFFCGARNGYFQDNPLLSEINITTPLMDLPYQELLADGHHRTILTSVQEADEQRFLGKELSDIKDNLNFESQLIDTFVIFDPLFRIRIPFSKNIIIEKDGHFICKIRSV